MLGSLEYFAVTTVHGPNWDSSKPIRDQVAWEAHASFMDYLVNEGFIVLGGPLDDGEQALCTVWDERVLGPIKSANLAEPELVTLHSSFRLVIGPLIDYIFELEKQNPGRKIAVLLPELVVKHWWENLLHNQRVQLLKLILLLRGNQRLVVVNIPWYL